MLACLLRAGSLLAFLSHDSYILLRAPACQTNTVCATIFGVIRKRSNMKDDKNPPALPVKVDHVIDQAISSDRVVGAVVLIAHDGKLVYQRAAGLADREAGQEMRLDTLFRLASLTKPIVSTAAMILVERGQLSLEDPVTRWLPNFRPALPNGERPTITVRQLLTHTSGLTYGLLLPPGNEYRRAGVSDGLDEPGRSMEDNLAR